MKFLISLHRVKWVTWRSNRCHSIEFYLTNLICRPLSWDWQKVRWKRLDSTSANRVDLQLFQEERERESESETAQTSHEKSVWNRVTYFRWNQERERDSVNNKFTREEGTQLEMKKDSLRMVRSIYDEMRWDEWERQRRCYDLFSLQSLSLSPFSRRIYIHVIIILMYSQGVITSFTLYLLCSFSSALTERRKAKTKRK